MSIKSTKAASPGTGTANVEKCQNLQQTDEISRNMRHHQPVEMGVDIFRGNNERDGRTEQECHADEGDSRTNREFSQLTLLLVQMREFAKEFEHQD